MLASHFESNGLRMSCTHIQHIFDAFNLVDFPSSFQNWKSNFDPNLLILHNRFVIHWMQQIFHSSSIFLLVSWWWCFCCCCCCWYSVINKLRCSFICRALFSLSHFTFKWISSWVYFVLSWMPKITQPNWIAFHLHFRLHISWE